jgi:hypothetical protein
MRIPSGVTDQYIYFVCVDATDLKTRETGVTGWSVYRSRNGAAAAAMTTPTINQVDATNMPGVYELLLDEDMTIAAGNDSEEMCFHIEATGIAPVTRVIELYRPKITAGNTLGVASDGDCVKVNTLDGHTAQTGDNYARLGAPAGASIAADLVVIDNFVDELESRLTAARAGYLDELAAAAIPADIDTLLTRLSAARAGYLDNLSAGAVALASALATVDTNVDAILVDTDATIPGLIAALNDLSAAQVNTEVDNAIVTYGLDHLVFTSVAGADVADNSIIAKLVSSAATADWDTFVNTDDSLQAISESGGGGPTAAQIADAVWDELQADHVTAGTFGILASEIADILADTNELQTDDVPGLIAALNDLSAAQVNTEVDTALSDIHLDHLLAVDYDPASKPGTATALLNELVESDAGVSRFTANALEQAPSGGASAADIADAVWDEAQADHVAAGSFGLIASEIADILVDTAVIGAAGAGLTAIPWNAAWDAEVQSEVADGLAAFWTTPATLVDLVWDEVLTGATHNVVQSAGRRLRNLQDFGVYEGGAIWVDTVNGTAGTTDYENGTVNNPVDTIADAKTLADSVGLKTFRVISGSSITLAATYSSYRFLGDNWTLALGGQAIDGALIMGATVSGTFSGNPDFHHCNVNGITGPNAELHGCGLVAANAIVINGAGDWFLDQCYSMVAGTGTPSIDFGAGVANSNVSFRHYSGGIEVKNIGDTGTDNMSLEGFGQLVLNANCDGGTIAVRGNFTVTDNSGNVTLSDDARIDVGQVTGYGIDLGAAYSGSTLTVIGIPTKGGVIQTGLGTMTFKVWNNDGTQNGSNMTDTTADAQGAYKASGTYTLAANTQYYLEASITMDSATRTIRIPITKIA